ncbi:MAG TPA: DUF5615 family PIN-like protein [Thermoanaerobaculia bacterium]|jgi:predicted nuclease of predicted toxin-antitoxin system
MRILLDECVDWRLLRDLAGHEVRTVRQMGWLSSMDGDLLRSAEAEFEALITTDKNLSFQQNVLSFGLAVVVLQGRTSRLQHLRELVPRLLQELPNVQAGMLHTVSWRALS